MLATRLPRSRAAVRKLAVWLLASCQTHRPVAPPAATKPSSTIRRTFMEGSRRVSQQGKAGPSYGGRHYQGGCAVTGRDGPYRFVNAIVNTGGPYRNDKTRFVTHSVQQAENGRRDERRLG